MEELTIRITLTNGKGWKETKSVSFDRLKNQEESLFKNYLNELMEEYQTMKTNNKITKKYIKEWRP